MATYVCSDIHGMFYEFKYLLEKINFSNNDKLYVLGDVIDRGTNSIKTLQFIMESKNIEMIVGNHELAMLDYYRGNWIHESWKEHEWFSFGGDTTRKEILSISKELKNELLDYIESLPYYLIVDGFLLAHGGFDLFNTNNQSIKEMSLEDALKINNKYTITWNRDFFKANKQIVGYTTILGHTPTLEYGKENIIFKDKKILIDCGLVFGGKLGCIRLDDMKEFYI